MNDQLFELINRLAGQNLVVDSTMIFLANNLLVFVLVISGLFAIIYKKRQGFVHLIITLILASVGAVIFKFLFDFQRPIFASDVHLLIPTPANPSFPSFDTSLAFAAAGVTFLYQRLFGAVAILLALLVGFSRIFVGVHYPEDIIVGAFLGMFSSVGSYFLSNKLTFLFGK